MRKLFLAVAAFVALTSIWMAATPVLARDYPFCIKGQGYITPTGDCSFDTYEQCLATASGRRQLLRRESLLSLPGRALRHSSEEAEQMALNRAGVRRLWSLVGMGRRAAR